VRSRGAAEPAPAHQPRPLGDAEPVQRGAGLRVRGRRPRPGEPEPARLAADPTRSKPTRRWT
jgi:hypothetical protein